MSFVATDTPRVGGYTRMYTGRQFYPLDPRTSDFDIQDIATGLSREPRWNGQTDETYSVAEHCVLVSRLVPVEYQLVALLHDASEAYMKDLPGPIKHLTALAAYREIESSVQNVIYKAFGVSPMPEEDYRRIIKTVDNRVLVTEARDLFSPPRFLGGKYEDIKPFPFTITPTGEIHARKMFMRAFREITEGLPRIVLR